MGPSRDGSSGVQLEKRIEDGPYTATEGFEVAREWAMERGMPDPGPAPVVEEE